MSTLGIGARLPRLEDERFSKAARSFVPTLRCPACCTRPLSAVRTRMRVSLRSESLPVSKRRFLRVRSRGGRKDPIHRQASGLQAVRLAGTGRRQGAPCRRADRDGDRRLACRGRGHRWAQVEIEFQQLPPVVSMWDALKNDAPLVHDDWGDNILVDVKLENGDLAAAKAAAAHVVERSVRMNRMHPLPLEGRACSRLI